MNYFFVSLTRIFYRMCPQTVLWSFGPAVMWTSWSKLLANLSFVCFTCSKSLRKEIPIKTYHDLDKSEKKHITEDIQVGLCALETIKLVTISPYTIVDLLLLPMSVYTPPVDNTLHVCSPLCEEPFDNRYNEYIYILYIYSLMSGLGGCLREVVTYGKFH